MITTTVPMWNLGMSDQGIEELKSFEEPALYDEIAPAALADEFEGGDEELDHDHDSPSWNDAEFEEVGPDYQYDATRLYLKELGGSQLLTADEEKHYGRLALKGDPAARKK